MKYLLIIIAAFLMTSCELIVLSSKKKNLEMELSQRTPVTTVHLFKNELDENNIKAASELLLQSNGSPYLAIQKYDIYDDLRRLKRVIGGKPVTHFKADSLSPIISKVKMEFNYLKAITFTTQKINDSWFITNYSE